MELFKASEQWANRPDDERFASLDEMHQATKAYADIAQTSHLPYKDLRVETMDNEVQLTGRTGVFAKFTHWAFGQLCRVVEAPQEYLRTLPATLACQNLNHGLKNREDTGTQAELLFHKNGNLLLRSLTSDRYARIWNHSIVSRLKTLENNGWSIPPARPVHNGQKGSRIATEQDVSKGNKSGLSIKVGDLIAPAGLYASDHDMFAFMVDENHPIDSGTGKPMYKGAFFWNSEVGASTFGMMHFLYDMVCGNHIVWGAKNVREVRIRHIGSADAKSTYQMQVELRRYAESSVGEIEMQIVRARKMQIETDKDKVLDLLFQKRITSYKNLEKAYDLAEIHQDVNGAPTTVWGMVSGLTRLSQETPYTDDRNVLDRQAGKLLEMSF